MQLSKVQAVIMAAVVLVAFLAILPTVITSTATAVATTGIDTPTTSILNLVPLVAVVGGIAAAGLIALAATKA